MRQTLDRDMSMHDDPLYRQEDSDVLFENLDLSLQMGFLFVFFLVLTLALGNLVRFAYLFHMISSRAVEVPRFDFFECPFTIWLQNMLTFTELIG